LSPRNIFCRDKKYSWINYQENIKAKIDHYRRLIYKFEKIGDHKNIKQAQILHAFYAFKLTKDKILNITEHYELLRNFGLNDEYI